MYDDERSHSALFGLQNDISKVLAAMEDAACWDQSAASSTRDCVGQLSQASTESPALLPEHGLRDSGLLIIRRPAPRACHSLPNLSSCLHPMGPQSDPQCHPHQPSHSSPTIHRCLSPRLSLATPCLASPSSSISSSQPFRTPMPPSKAITSRGRRHLDLPQPQEFPTSTKPEERYGSVTMTQSGADK